MQAMINEGTVKNNMRKNQVTIKIERFGDQVPEIFNANSLEINVYADSNNVYEALALAYQEALNQIKTYGDNSGINTIDSSVDIRKRKEE